MDVLKSLKSAWDKGTNAVEDTWSAAKDAWSKGDNVLESGANLSKTIFNKSLEFTGDALNNAVDLGSKGVEKLRELDNPAINGIIDFTEKSADTAKNYVFDPLKEHVIDPVREAHQRAVKGMQNSDIGVVKSIGNAYADAENKIKNTFDNITDKVSDKISDTKQRSATVDAELGIDNMQLAQQVGLEME